MGRFFLDVNPQCMLIAGKPVAFAGIVYLETAPEPGPLRGCSWPHSVNVGEARMGAATGVVGVAMQSTSWNTRRYSSLMIRCTFNALA